MVHSYYTAFARLLWKKKGFLFVWGCHRPHWKETRTFIYLFFNGETRTFNALAISVKGTDIIEEPIYISLYIYISIYLYIYLSPMVIMEGIDLTFYAYGLLSDPIITIEAFSHKCFFGCLP